jgi:hypothetical protein
VAQLNMETGGSMFCHASGAMKRVRIRKGSHRLTSWTPIDSGKFPGHRECRADSVSLKPVFVPLSETTPSCRFIASATGG